MRAPPIELVKKWGNKLSAEQIKTVNEGIKWRGQLGNLWFSRLMKNSYFFYHLGPDSGALNNTKKWKATTPHNFKSIYICQGDLGFFSYKSKKYGVFFCAVQTFTRRVFAVPIPNSSTSSLIKAIEQMVKVRPPVFTINFLKINQYLFSKRNLNLPGLYFLMESRV